jgi:hypothetical protein
LLLYGNICYHIVTKCGGWVTIEQIKMLNKMKKLIKSGHRRFAPRSDRDYIQELLEIGISEEEAWQEILSLTAFDYKSDYKN